MAGRAGAALLSILSFALVQPGCPRGTLPAYSHNDYVNAHPLRDALSLGYVGVEADVFLVDGTLRLGHDRKAAERGALFEAQYLAPLDSLVMRCGRLTANGLPFLLDVELKEPSRPAFDTLVALLARHRDLPPSAIQIVLVGWYPPNFALAAPVPLWRQEHLRRADARAMRITDSTVGLISLDYRKTMGRWWVGGEERKQWLATIRATKDAFPALRIRAHDVPVSERVYRDLLGAGVDLIGTMSLAATAQRLGAIARSTPTK
ncbi:MAG TPA: hypothetical protein VH539_18865 [Gemmatimonadaceae bacterium]